MYCWDRIKINSLFFNLSTLIQPLKEFIECESLLIFKYYFLQYYTPNKYSKKIKNTSFKFFQIYRASTWLVFEPASSFAKKNFIIIQNRKICNIRYVPFKQNQIRFCTDICEQGSHSTESCLNSSLFS